jgi:hypothetical protein
MEQHSRKDSKAQEIQGAQMLRRELESFRKERHQWCSCFDGQESHGEATAFKYASDL